MLPTKVLTLEKSGNTKKATIAIQPLGSSDGRSTITEKTTTLSLEPPIATEERERFIEQKLEEGKRQEQIILQKEKEDAHRKLEAKRKEMHARKSLPAAASTDSHGRPPAVSNKQTTKDISDETSPLKTT